MSVVIVCPRQKAVDREGQQIAGRQKGADKQDHRSQPAENRAGSGKGRRVALQAAYGQIPFADKTARGRDADQPQRGDRIAPHGERHFLTDAPQLFDPCPAGGADDSTGHKEQDGFDKTVGQHMQQSAGDGGDIHHCQTEQDIGELAYRGVGQSFLQYRFPVGQHGTHKYGEQRKSQPCPLHPAAPQEIRAEDIVDHTHNRQHAGLDDDRGERGGGRSRGYGMGGRQPGVHREHTGLDAEAQQTDACRDQQYGRISTGSCTGQAVRSADVSAGCHVQHAACRKGQRTAVFPDKIDAEQCHISPAQGIEKVFQSCHNGFPAAVVQHQGHGSESQHLEEQIESDQISGEAECVQHPKYDQIKAIVTFFLLLMLHIGKRKEPCAQQYDQRQSREQHTRLVNVKADGQRCGEVEKRIAHIIASGQRSRDQHSRQKVSHAHCRKQSGPDDILFW